MARRLVVIACAAAGIFVLAGVGWSLLTLGVLLEVGWPRQRPAWLEDVTGRARRVGVALAGRIRAGVRAIPQQLAAVGSAGAGMALVPVGVGLVAGVGPALVVLGVLALVLGLLLDRAA